MTARDTYNASVKAAHATLTAAQTAAEQSRQTTIDASLSVIGARTGVGSSATLEAAIKSANAAKVAALTAAEQAKQAAIAVARDTLRNSGTDNAAF
jgi:hypothetical protein